MLIQGFFLITERRPLFGWQLKITPNDGQLERSQQMVLGLLYFFGGLAITISIILEIAKIAPFGTATVAFGVSVIVIVFGIIIFVNILWPYQEAKTKQKNTQPSDETSYFDEE
jgi:succinate-acetate transporter protein